MTKLDDVVVFKLFQKLDLLIYASQFMKNFSTFICPFESRKCKKEGKKIQTFE